MNPSNIIDHRDRGPPIALPGAKGKDNKRSSRPFGHVDTNASGRQHVAGDFILPKSPNPTLKKKPKSTAIDSAKVGYMQPKSNSFDPDDIVSALDKMTIADPTAQGTTEVDWKPLQKALDDLFVKQSQERMKGVPMIEMPEILVKNGVQLFDHQVEGIRWLTHKEVTNTDIPPYYTLRKYGAHATKWYCTLDMRTWPYENNPEPLRHSILADDMGLGKTVQSIGLILSNPPAGRDGIKAYPYEMPRKSERVPPRCTIIVSPVSVMSNWQMEIDKFVHNKKEDILKVEMYHGPKRVETLRKVQEGKVDILICSYQTLGWDLKKYRKMQGEKVKLEFSSDGNAEEVAEASLNDDDPFIFDQIFHRIILDEAHMMRNSSTNYSKAVKYLNATHKLCLTGTPFVNHPRDIHAFLDFLDVTPYNHIETFNYHVVEKIEQRKEVGLARLRVLMGAIAIRRTKKEVDQGIKLPEKSVQIRKIAFPEFCGHKQINEMFYRICRAAFIANTSSDDGQFRGDYARLFGMVIRIRQSCCDASLIPNEVHDEVASVWEGYRNIDIDDLDVEDGLRLSEKLLGALHTAKERIEAAKMDGMDVVDNQVYGRSPKVQALLDAITEMKRCEKGVIYSQFTQFLDIIQCELEAEGHSFMRIDGSMNATERYEAMKAFEADGPRTIRGPRFMLCSLRACNTGITLTRANHIFLMDTWWNVAEENQAMDRVHRIGQTRKVRVIRFIMKDSIEERFIEVQDAKEALAKGSMERLKKEDRRKASITALKDLFEMKARAHVWEGAFVDDDDLDGFIVPDEHIE